MKVLTAAGLRVHLPKPAAQAARPLCCGRTLLAVGLVERGSPRGWSAASRRLRRSSAGNSDHWARAELRARFSRRIPALVRSKEARLLADNVLLIEEYLQRPTRGYTQTAAPADCQARTPARPLSPEGLRRHAGGRGGAPSLSQSLPSRPSTRAAAAWREASATGVNTVDVSLKMGELSLFPAVRKALPKR